MYNPPQAPLSQVHFYMTKLQQQIYVQNVNTTQLRFLSTRQAENKLIPKVSVKCSQAKITGKMTQHNLLTKMAVCAITCPIPMWLEEDSNPYKHKNFHYHYAQTNNFFQGSCWWTYSNVVVWCTLKKKKSLDALKLLYTFGGWFKHFGSVISDEIS